MARFPTSRFLCSCVATAALVSTVFVGAHPAVAASKRQTIEQVNARLDLACIAYEAVTIPTLTDDTATIAPTFKGFVKALTAYDARVATVTPADPTVTTVVKGLRKFVAALKSESNLIISLSRSNRTVAKASDLAIGFNDKFSARGETIAATMEAVDLTPCASLLLTEEVGERVDLPAANFPPITGFAYVEGTEEREIADDLFESTDGFYSMLTVKSVNDAAGTQVAFIAGYSVANPANEGTLVESGVKFISGVEDASVNGFRVFFGAQGNFDKALVIRGPLAFEFTTEKNPSQSLVRQIALAFTAAQPAQ